MIAATPIRERLLEIEANARLLTELRGTPAEEFVRVHGYLAIDRRELHRHLSRVEDFSEFIRHIHAYLTTSA